MLLINDNNAVLIAFILFALSTILLFMLFAIKLFERKS
jgi:hypothetical protein